MSTAVKILSGLLLVKLFALQFGTQGLGQAANFMTLITVLGVFAGAGIFNGITKYVAEFSEDPAKSATLFATSSRIILCFSALLAVIFVLFSASLSEWLFFRRDLQNVVIATALAQFGIAWSNYALAILKGRRDAKGNALSIVVGTLLGVAAFIVGLYGFGYQGALIGLVLMPALTFLPAQLFLKKQGVRLCNFSAKFDRLQALSLSKFSAMVLITAVTLPLGYILLRDLLMQRADLHAVGLWQGVAKISDAYLQFITAAFSVYLLPTFAKLQEKAAIKRELGKSLRIVALAVIVVSSVVYLLREWIILLLYSAEFLAMEKLFFWQLLGDICKVLAYIFGYLIVAKGALKLYALAEIFQVSVLLGSGNLLIPQFGAEGATMAYFATYALYLTACLIGAKIYLKDEQKQ